MKENNIYYRARMQAVERDRLFASRERVADLIYVSAEALYDYESGKTTPPCDAARIWSDTDVLNSAEPATFMNDQPTPLDGLADLLLRGPIGELLPPLCRA